MTKEQIEMLRRKMINLINKILAIFQLKLVSTKPVNLVEETVEFLNTIPKGALGDVDMSGYVGDIVYVMDKNDKTYFRQQVLGTKDKYFDYVLGTEDRYFDYDGGTYTTEELQEKLK